MRNLVNSFSKLLKNHLKKPLKMSDSNSKDDKRSPERGESSKSDKKEFQRSTEKDTESFTVDSLQKYLAEKLHLSDYEEEEKVKVLDSFDLDGIVSYINKTKCKNIITMAGAGISTSAGIPDFRSPESGLYHNLQKYDLPHPQAIFELDFFHKNPKPFFVLAKELYPGCFRPTISHYFIRLLAEKGLLLRHYSQNIDTLERVAGIPEHKIVEAHGTFFTGHCLECRIEYSLEWMKEKIFNDQIPYCQMDKCEGVVKPDIVFFGETLPMRFYTLIESDFKKCDLLIILGSSLIVQPFASLIDMVPDTCPRLLINREKVGHKSGWMAMLGMSGGFEFDDKKNSRDVALLGDCDDGSQQLADKLGWGEELKKLREREISKIEESEKRNKVKSSI